MEENTRIVTKVTKDMYEDNLKYIDEVILKYFIEEANIMKSSYLFGEEVFNNYNRKLTLELQHLIFTSLFREARDLYNDSKKHGFPFHAYEVDNKFTVTYNKDEFISLYTDTYTYTGGAHGSTIRRSQNWDLEDGLEYTLASLYPNTPNYREMIIDNIINQIAQSPDNYFEDYAKLVRETFREENFYRTGDSEITIYFQQYDIAPYSSGIPTFRIEL